MGEELALQDSDKRQEVKNQYGVKIILLERLRPCGDKEIKKMKL